MMEDFKFVCRDNELACAKNALASNDLVIYYYFDNSGVSHYLKKLAMDLCVDEQRCFYIDCARPESVAIQIAEQVLSNCEKSEIDKYTRSGNEVFRSVVLTLFSAVDLVPVVNIGMLAKGLIGAIKDTVDVDIDHISDYKIEKALINMFQKINNTKKSDIYILLDNADMLSPTSLDFLAKMLTLDISKIMFTIPQNAMDSGIEIISKLLMEGQNVHKIDDIFQRPDNQFICGLFECYKQKIKDEYFNIFDQHERNIHIIMSFIRGFNMDFLQLNPELICILKILLILNTNLAINILKNVYEKSAYLLKEISDAEFMQYIVQLRNFGFLDYPSDNVIHLNKNIVTERNIKISLVEKLTISRHIVDVFEQYRETLTIPQLKFAIHNLDKDYNRRKRYILLLLQKQKGNDEIDQQYLDQLFYLENKNELLQVCSMYYNLQVYDVPYLRMKQHPDLCNEHECQILLALLQERMHKGNYCDNLWDLIRCNNNRDESCLIIAILFTALYNNGENEQCHKILNEETYEYYYKNYEHSRYFPFLLRNISYYIEDVNNGIENYNYCLAKFKNHDCVNYNRTLSNFIGYLMNHDDDKYAQIFLKQKIQEAFKILEFNDSKYLYLNINYGIYLMRELDEDPTKYFDAILYNSGTTETPYIYAKINQALYVSKKDPAKALVLLDEIFNESIRETCVVPTKIFYKINRILVEYMNGINDENLLEEIRQNPLRGNTKYAQKLYSIYKYKFTNKIKYSKLDWKRLSLPGYIFYHGFDAQLLLSSFDNPNCNI
ncbi:MAG: hypothetical protein K2N73_07880 [Lachnospiraceae bacterium]|nr:hypothetical protein [Lachnospiraceae bacterium]